MQNALTQLPFVQELRLSPQALLRLRRQAEFARLNQQRFAQLSGREREILGLICQGLSNEEIGRRIFRSVNTVRTHRNNIWRRLGIRSVVEAVRWAQAFDLV